MPAKPAVAHCAHLTVTAPGPVDAAAGHRSAIVVFTNNGPTCTVTGYPRFTGVTTDGRAVQAKRTANGFSGGVRTAPTVTLTQGQAISAIYEGVGFDPATGNATCPQFAAFLVASPGDARPTRIPTTPETRQLCALEVHPVVAGKLGGRQAPPRPDTVLADCLGVGQVRPATVVLACADGNAELHGLRWRSWSTAVATGTGTETLNDCVPSCAGGHLHSYPVTVTLSGTSAWSGHGDRTRFRTLTVRYAGARPSGTASSFAVPLTD